MRRAAAALALVTAGGCATATLTGAERAQMLARYRAWAPDLARYAAIAHGAYRSRHDRLPADVAFTTAIVAVPEGPPGATIAYVVATDDAARTHDIGVEGTEDFEQLLIDARALPLAGRELSIVVHRGFEAVAAAIFGDLAARGVLREGYRIRLTGHSLGGAVAVLLAVYLEQRGRTVDRVITFGQPMITDADGVAAVASVMRRTVRVVACDDVVPFLPPIGYAHGGAVLLLLDRPYFQIEDADIGRPFWVPLVQDTRHMLENRRLFSGHAMADYIERLSEPPRTVPYRYTERDARYCGGLAAPR